MKLFIFEKPKTEPWVSIWTLLWVFVVTVVLLIVVWEVVELFVIKKIDPTLLIRVEAYRNVISVTILLVTGVFLVTRNWRRSEREIAAKNHFLASIVDNNRDVVFILDREGRILFWNKSAEEVLGYSKAEAVGKNIIIIWPQDSDQPTGVIHFMQVIFEKGFVNDYEMEILAKGSKRILARVFGAQVQDSGGGFLGVVVSFRYGVSGQTQDAAEQSDKVAAMAQLVAFIAHEIGTPLNVIGGNAEYLLSGRDASRTPGRELKIIVDETERISKLIQRLMHITQPQFHVMEEIQVNDVVCRIMDFTAHVMEKSKIAVEKYLEENLPKIRGDSDQLVQVLLNLVMNAVQAMPDGGRFSVSTSLWYVNAEKSPVVQVRLIDTGIGISRENMEKIFDPFFSTKRVKGVSGLGLPISYRIIASHGGTVKIDSLPGKGTSVTIRFPSVE